MAPKKMKTWNESTYQDLMYDYGLRFEGSKQPPDWPKEHRHLFEVIRDIWALRYTKYRKSNKLSKQAMRVRRDTAAEISERAHRLHFGQINEDTWRGLEGEVMRLFERKAVCECCKQEKHMIEREAEPSAHDELAKLKRKRERRRLCTCDLDSGSVNVELEDSDEAQPIIFTLFKSTSVMHDALDKLETTNIPMQPDCTVSLNVSPRMRQALRATKSELSHCPMIGTNEGLYPFLLIEAKRGVKAPGWAAIEAQTAFPLRRLLMLQESLQRKAGVHLDPLIWFFAYQGEEWRLYAGILREANVHVYDLWHGSVESLDGSLQLLQIVDYLWTWARDIYRPQIRNCLYALAPSIREISPSTDSDLRRSQSVLSELRSGALTAALVDVIMGDDQHADDLAPQTALCTAQYNGRLSGYSPNMPHPRQEGFPQSVLRHSNLIEFSFRAFCCPTRDQISQYPQIEPGYKRSVENFELLLRSSLIVPVTHEQITNLERFWTGQEVTKTSLSVSSDILEERKGAYFYFRTFCRQKDWQIVRELNCVVWNLADIQRHRATEQQEVPWLLLSSAGKPDHYATVVELLSMIRSISGKISVSFALNNTMLRLSYVPASQDDSSQMQWAEGNSPHMEQFENSNSRSYWPPSFYQESAPRIVALGQKPQESELVEYLVPVPKEMGQMGGILAKKPRSWSAQCPRFCLFVFLEIEASEREQLKQLLSDVVRQREIYGAIDETSEQDELFIDAKDRGVIRRWLESL